MVKMVKVDTRMNHSMVKIREGQITLRDDRKKIQWQAEIRPFELSIHPVTVELYHSVKNHPIDSSEQRLMPMVNISWEDAIAFCNLLSQKSGLKGCYTFDGDRESVICDFASEGYRLPTEAEWQYACKAGSDGYRYGELDEIAWYDQNSGGKPHEVGTKMPNAWGLYDMLGNVWEWCWDVYDETVYGPYRVFRGGSWAEEARGCGASCRRRSHPSFRIDDLGFRLARSC